MHRCKNTEKNKQMDQLLMIATDPSSQSPLRVIKLRYLLKDRPFFLSWQRLELLPELLDIGYSLHVIKPRPFMALREDSFIFHKLEGLGHLSLV
jgi:hypothetical protein